MHIFDLNSSISNIFLIFNSLGLSENAIHIFKNLLSDLSRTMKAL